MSPIAAQLCLGHLRQCPELHAELRFALIHALMQRSVASERVLPETTNAFQAGLLLAPPALSPGPVEEALRFVFSCRNYDDGQRWL